MKISTLKYKPELWQKWLKGDLSKEWKKRYPKLFDEEDLRLVLAQPSYHFIEWLGAIYFFGKGYLSLVEHYVYKPHLRKLEIVKKYLGNDGLDFLRRKGRKSKVQPPDLFVYKDNEFFFAEVKSPSDKIRQTQEEFFQEIEEKFNTEVVILRAIEVPNQ